jgi:hypothetical protein
MSKFEIYVKIKYSLQLVQCKGPKKATFRRCRSHYKIYKCKCFHAAMPNFNTVLLNKQN